MDYDNWAEGYRSNAPHSYNPLNDPNNSRIPYSSWRIPVSVVYIGIAMVVGFFAIASFF
ncbi:hypothetical protein ACSSZE_03215 [Acidithiobacillus caldus]